ncbi:MAG: lipopolysaccharide heptosyltransferase [Gammaproteobacteria bacterium]|nr:MAG: lipopolysaccharide heptosyltransferase [Gammaproteobacteria bacterium]
MTKENNTLAIAPQRILVIAMRYLGDLMLSTPLLHTLRMAYPDATIDVLTYRNNAGLLEGNRDVDNVIETIQHQSWAEFGYLLKRIFQHYDLAITLEINNRRYFYARLAAKNVIGFVPQKHNKGHWKKHLLTASVEFDNDYTHTILEIAKLGDLLGIPAQLQQVAPYTDHKIDVPDLTDNPYVVLHTHPQWRYKRWPVTNWILIAEFLIAKGYIVILSGGPDRKEQAYIEEIFQPVQIKSKRIVNLAGQLSLAQLAKLLASAKLFIGPDTGITHLAAATGSPMIALFGPTNPVKWAPWPLAYTERKNPFQKKGDQTINNVTLLQWPEDCVPCQNEGCDLNRESDSRCLLDLPVSHVVLHIKKLLNLK